MFYNPTFLSRLVFLLSHFNLYSPLDESFHTSFNTIIENFKKLEDPDRYYNWYMGFTKIDYPKYEFKDFEYVFQTCATSGNISTPYFGDKFDIEKIDGNMVIAIYINVPYVYWRKSTLREVFEAIT